MASSNSPICKVCSQVLTGMDTIFNDSGAGVILAKCPRCHNTSHHLDEVAIAAFNKHAGMLDGISDSLKQIAPAVAAAGVWDLMVAYDTFKKVLKNTLRMQERSSPLYNPFWATGAKTAETEPERDLICPKCGACECCTNHAPDCPIGNPKTAGRDAESCINCGFVYDLKVDYPEGKCPDCDTSKKTSALKKKADDEEGFSEENHSYMPKDDDQSETANPSPFHFEDNAADAAEVKIALSQIQDFLHSVIPHVVAYAMEKKDAEVLRALGHLGTVIREARKSWRMAQELQTEEYNRTYLASPSTDLSDFIQ